LRAKQHTEQRLPVVHESDGEADAVRCSVEALLFVAKEALSIQQLAYLTQASEEDVVLTLRQLGEEYAQRGIVVRHIAGGYRFATAPRTRAVVETYLAPPKTALSVAAMETLAIIAYLQPLTKADLQAVRGVSVDSVVSTLLECGFIEEAGQRDILGRPMAYRTSEKFLEAFNLHSIADLPPVDIDCEKTQS